MAQNRICSLLGIRYPIIHDIPPAAKLIESIIADLKKHFAALEKQIGAFA